MTIVVKKGPSSLCDSNHQLAMAVVSLDFLLITRGEPQQQMPMTQDRSQIWITNPLRCVVVKLIFPRARQFEDKMKNIVEPQESVVNGKYNHKVMTPMIQNRTIRELDRTCDPGFA